MEYRWDTSTYDHYEWEYSLHLGEGRAKLGVVERVIRARQSYDEPIFEYQARAFTTKQKMVFNTRAEAQAWVTACERIN